MRPDLQDIVDEAARILRADTTLEDQNFNLIAYGTQRFGVDAVRSNSILQRRSTRPIRVWFEQFGITDSEVPVRTPADEGMGVHARLCFPARWRGVTYGYIWALNESTPLDDPDVARTAKLAESVGASLAQFGRQHADCAFDVAELNSADVESVSRAAVRVADRGLIERGVPVVAVVIRTSGASVPEAFSPNLWNIPRQVLTDPGPRSTTLVVPLRETDNDEPALAVAAVARQLYRDDLPAEWEGSVVAGIGQPRADIADLRASWLEARLAARVAIAVPDMGPTTHWEDLGIYRLLAAVSDAELTRLMVDEPVRRLLDETEPDLAHTVGTYLDLAGNVQDAAAALHIHRQTLYYRIKKVETLTGLDLTNGNDRTRLHVGLKMAALLEAE